MPIYEFCCQDCQRVYEELVGVNEGKAPPCPSCGSAKTSRVPSAAAVKVAGGKSAGPSSCSPRKGFS